MRGHDTGDEEVDQGDGERRRGHERGDRDDPEHGGTHRDAGEPGHPDGPGEGDQRDHPEIEGQPTLADVVQTRLLERPATANGAAQPGAPAADQVEADMATPLRVLLAGGDGHGHLQRHLRHLGFRAAGAKSEILDDMAVVVARGEVLHGVGLRGIAPEDALHAALRFDEELPVHGGEETQTADAVGDREVLRSLHMAVGLELLGHGGALLGEHLVDPVEEEPDARALSLEALHKFLEEGRAQHRMRVGELGEQVQQLLRRLLRRGERAFGPANAVVFLQPSPRDAHGDATQIFDESQAQRDRERPQLAELQRLDGLVGAHEGRRVLLVEQAVEVRDQFERHAVDARKPLHLALGQARQLAAVAARQVDAGELDLLFDQIEIVQQPLRGRRHAAPLGIGSDQHLVRLAQRGRVVGEPRQQLVVAGAVVHLVRMRQLLRVAPELVDAQQLGAQRLLVHRRRSPEPRSPGSGVPPKPFKEFARVCSKVHVFILAKNSHSDKFRVLLPNTFLEIRLKKC